MQRFHYEAHFSISFLSYRQTYVAVKCLHHFQRFVQRSFTLITFVKSALARCHCSRDGRISNFEIPDFFLCQSEQTLFHLHCRAQLCLRKYRPIQTWKSNYTYAEAYKLDDKGRVNIHCRLVDKCKSKPTLYCPPVIFIAVNYYETLKEWTILRRKSWLNQLQTLCVLSCNENLAVKSQENRYSSWTLSGRNRPVDQLSQPNRAAACVIFGKSISAKSVHLTLRYPTMLTSTILFYVTMFVPNAFVR